MIVHVVLFTFNDNLTTQERQEFMDGIETLRGVKSAKTMYIGTPVMATAVRPIVDTAYNVALTVLFEDLAAHDAYQVDPLHKAFVAKSRPMCSRVRIFDAQ